MKASSNVRSVVFLVLLLSFPSIVLAWSGKVVNVADGDTISVLRDGQQVKSRLYGIDCPEKAQPYGQKAREVAASMVAGKTVDVVESGRPLSFKSYECMVNFNLQVHLLCTDLCEESFFRGLICCAP